MSQKKILLLNGPNLNMLGVREPGIYGDLSLQAIIDNLHTIAKSFNIDLIDFQSNAEFEIINKIHSVFGKVDYIIINPAAFTHTSVAIRDALLAVRIPFFEVHISNVHAREEFRHHSFFFFFSTGVICGFGPDGYEYALRAAIKKIQ